MKNNICKRKRKFGVTFKGNVIFLAMKFSLHIEKEQKNLRNDLKQCLIRKKITVFHKACARKYVREHYSVITCSVKRRWG